MRGPRDALLIRIMLIAAIGLAVLASRVGQTPGMTRQPGPGTSETWIAVPRALDNPYSPRRTLAEPPGAVDPAERNDLRVFLADMARAQHDGNSIGIVDDSPIPNWSDGKQASDR